MSTLWPPGPNRQSAGLLRARCLASHDPVQNCTPHFAFREKWQPSAFDDYLVYTLFKPTFSMCIQLCIRHNLFSVPDIGIKQALVNAKQNVL